MKKKISLRTQLIIMLIGFVAVSIGIFSIFQIFFLDDIYKNNKINSIKKICSDISESIQDNKINEYFNTISLEEDVCIRIISSSYDLSYGNERIGFSLNRLSNSDINVIAKEIYSNKGSKLFDTSDYSNSEGIMYMFGKITPTDYSDVLVLVSAVVVPLSATKNTILYEYLFISIILVIMAILLALIISRTIIKPIKEINESAKNLSKAEYNNIDCTQSELSELNDTLLDANVHIKKADIAKKELLANVSHDLRTPLTMISGYAEMIRDLSSKDKDEYANVIIEESKRLSSLVEDLVDLSSIESDNLILKKEDVSLNELLYDVYNQYHDYCKKMKIDLSINVAEDIIINVDIKRIKQVLYNFINNAINYNDKDEKTIEIGCKRNRNTYHIYVLDNGNGIKQTDLKSIWDRYYKIDETHKRAFVGSGIGLSISKHILEKHKIKYGVKSKINEFSEFYFEIKKSK